MSFQQALSGLSAASTNLDTIGNNISNASTVGFKDSTAEFSDVFATALNGGVNNQVGLGTRVSQVAQSFTQGNIETTSNPLNVAINGNGFFRMDTNGTISYSRDGQFQIDNQGYLINSTGAKVTGFLPTTSATGVTTINVGAAADLQLNTSNVLPNPTTTLATTLNLDSSGTATGTGLAVSANFNPTKPATYNNSTSATVYDSLGDPHTLTTFYQKEPTGTSAAGNAWNVFATLDGNQVVGTGVVLDNSATPTAIPNSLGQLVFNSSGAIVSSTPATSATGVTSFPIALPLTNGAATPLSISLNLTGSTQYASAFAVSNVTQDGYASGNLTGFTIGANGVIQGNYSNGTSKPLGQIATTSFNDPNGLQPIGNASWVQTAASGAPQVGVPGTGSLGTLQGSSLEQSNVDLTKSLVDLITAQRVYQANAQTVKTQDQILQTIVSLQ